MSLSAGSSSPEPARLLSWRSVGGLGLVAVLEGAWACGAAWNSGSGTALAQLFRPDLLPAALACLGVALGLLLAPAWGLPEAGWGAWGRALFLGAWQAAALGYFLLAASRLEPLEGGALWRCVAVVASTAALAALGAARLPRAYAGLAFFWSVGLPLFSYLLAEMLLSTPAGGGTWGHAAGPARAVRVLVEAALGLSPGAAAVGALNGALPGGAAFGWKETGIFVGLAMGGAALILFFPRARASGAQASRSGYK